MSLMDVLSVSATGLEVQSARMRTMAENLANSQTTRTPDGGPYKRRDVVVESTPMQTQSFAGHFAAAMAEPLIGVRVSELVVDEQAVELRYEPQHPDANGEGYVSYPKVNPAEEMVNMQSAASAYGANIAAMTTAKEMLRRSMELFR